MTPEIDHERFEREIREELERNPLVPFKPTVDLSQHSRRLSKPATTNHKAGAPADGRTGAEIITAYFRDLYRADFRRGNAIHSHMGEMVSQVVACGAPTTRLYRLLESASDAPRHSQTSGGGVNVHAIAGFCRKYASAGWGDYLAELPDEDEAALGAGSLAGDEFQRMVTDAMNTEVVLGDIIDHMGVTQTERRSLIDWCVKFAKPGPWKSIRSKKCWCKLIDLTGGEFLLRVAIRRELFAQLRADPVLCKMNQNTFSRRAARYGVGSSSRDDRPGGMFAVVLDDAFVAALTEGPNEPEPDAENLAQPSDPNTADGPSQNPEGVF